MKTLILAILIILLGLTLVVFGGILIADGLNTLKMYLRQKDFNLYIEAKPDNYRVFAEKLKTKRINDMICGKAYYTDNDKIRGWK